MSQRRELVVGVAEEVRDFYDRYPYPRPIDNLDDYKCRWQDPQRRRADFHLFWPSEHYRENQSILIAGCGTSQAAKHALRWPEAQVTGIDCSETSARHSEELKRKHGLKNLQVHQLAIEDVGDLGLSFDQIVCTGVLHHLADPEAGLRALRGVLNPGGAMHLMVYAPYGRAGIYLLQEFCRRVGIHPTDEEIRDLIVALCALPQGHPLQSLLAHAPDFREEAALADALLNPNDRAYSVPQLFGLIEKCGLKFGRWFRQAPYSVNCGIVKTLPQASRIAALPLQEQFAAIELFRGTMIRHSVIAYCDESTASSQQISFAENDWLSYVPCRMPETICVQERLPAGTAAVLINRTHTYTDVFLPVSDLEKRLFDAVDGCRKIEELMQMTDLDSLSSNSARSFFERLWWHDQMVFDTA